MFLTRTELNARRSGARKLLSSPQALHAALLQGFPSDIDPGRVLWRIDTDSPLRPMLYVVSAARPDLTHLEEQGGWPSHPTTQSANYTGLLDSLHVGQQWAFRLRANPTHRFSQNDRKRVIAHVTVQYQLQWLLDRADALGVSFQQDGVISAAVVGRETIRFRRLDSTVTLGTALYEGVLRVEDAERLRTALVTGVGRAKAYGCGLMTLAKP